jgi:hypothetical protein
MDSLAQLQRKAEDFVGALRQYDPDGAERFDSALEQGWFDHASMAEIVSDLRMALAEEIRPR